jgi:hypothetical protein
MLKGHSHYIIVPWGLIALTALNLHFNVHRERKSEKFDNVSVTKTNSNLFTFQTFDFGYKVLNSLLIK